jgi:plastocyanin
MWLRLIVGFSVLALSGCTKGQSSPDIASPTGPSNSDVSAVANASATGRAASVPREVMVNAKDACDPDTFNAAIAPGTCVGTGGGVTFQQFIEALTRLGSIGSWHFAPPNLQARVGQSFLVTNRGGEVHTFTEVEEFGGGIVPMLNDLAHVPNVAPECKTLEPDDFVAPGATYVEGIEEAGVEKYQCCIHPWMRLEAHVTDK